MTTAAAVFDVPRDRWGRPLIIPEDGGKPVGYTRVTTLAKALDDTTALADWKCRQTAVGIAGRDDLRALVAVKKNDKRELQAVVKQAMDAAASDAAANTGTALHAFTEHLDTGGQLADIPAEHHPHLRAYQQALQAAGITVLACERFIVLDDLQVAGTFDRLLLLPDGRIVIGDIKTGASVPDYALSTAIQVACYARGRLYHPDSGERRPLPGVDTTTGVLIHLPQNGTPRCGLHVLDLQVGWIAAAAAYEVRAMRKLNPATPWTPAVRR